MVACLDDGQPVAVLADIEGKIALRTAKDKVLNTRCSCWALTSGPPLQKSYSAMTRTEHSRIWPQWASESVINGPAMGTSSGQLYDGTP